VNIWKTFSEKFYEGKFGFLGGLEETWGAKEKFSNSSNKMLQYFSNQKSLFSFWPSSKE
jgi:hypothetical protein